jgi:hypothetical protein
MDESAAISAGGCFAIADALNRAAVTSSCAGTGFVGGCMRDSASATAFFFPGKWATENEKHERSESIRKMRSSSCSITERLRSALQSVRTRKEWGANLARHLASAACTAKSSRCVLLNFASAGVSAREKNATGCQRACAEGARCSSVAPMPVAEASQVTRAGHSLRKTWSFSHLVMSEMI